MEIKDILVAPDFLNLIKNDIDEILKDMEIEIDEGHDERSHLYNLKESLFDSEKSKNIIKNKILAGRTSIKWYEVNIFDDELDEVIEKLESEENNYNQIAHVNTTEIENPEVYTCIKLEEFVYMMRVFIPIGSKTINNGINLEKIPSISNAVLLINLRDRYIEIRASYRNAKKIFSSICKPIFGDNVKEVEVLERHNECIEEFKDSLNDSKFFDVKSIPDSNITLTIDQNELLVNILEILDECFINKDIERLKTQLGNIDFGPEDMPFTQLFLAGLSKIGLTIRDDFKEDLSSQSLYGILKSYMTNQEGFIEFKLLDEEEIETSYTIQVGITTNTISFRSFSTEKSINYIRSIVLGY